jgi:hypothetical protein
MEDIRHKIKLRHEKKTCKCAVVQTLKDKNGNVKFIKIGFNGWERVTEKHNTK